MLPVSREPVKAKHETVPVQHGKVLIDIDAALAPLIRVLWDRGIDTYQCCQEARPGEACIQFPGTNEVEEFLYLAKARYKVELEVVDESRDGEHRIGVSLLVYFPPEDVPRLVESLAPGQPEPEKPKQRRKGRGKR
jgi:hypothetical protein